MSIRTICLLGFATILMAADSAQDPATVWQTLVLSSLRAAGSKDYKSAEDLMQKAVRQAEQFPAGDARTGTTYNTLGLIYKEEKKTSDAEKMFVKALAILEKAYGSDSLDAANVNFNIASAQVSQGQYDSALPYIQRSRATYEKILGETSNKTISTFCLLGEVYRNQKKFAEAEEPLKDCADMREAAGGVENPELASALYNLALVYIHQGKFALAEPCLKLAAKIRERTIGITSPEFAEALEAHATLLHQMNRDAEARRDEAMIEAIRHTRK